MVDIFTSSLAFHWEPRISYPFCGASEKWDYGTQKCGTPYSRNIRHLKTGRAEFGSLLSVGPFGQCRSQASGANFGWPETTPLELPGLDFPGKWQGGHGESQNTSAPSPLRVSEHSGRWRSRASSEDIVGGAQTSDSSSNLLCATHETVTCLSLDLYLS